MALTTQPTDAKRVLLLSHESPECARGGLGVVVGELAREFEVLGAEVTLVTADDTRFPSAGREPALDPYALPRPEERDSALSSFIQRALAAAESSRPHAVHAHDWVAIDAGLHVREALGTRLVAHVHSTEWDRALGRVDSWIVAREGAGLRAADRVICVSERTRGLVCARHGVDRERTSVVHPGLPQSLFAPAHTGNNTPSEGPPLVLFLGRLVPQKGVDLFLRTAERVKQALPQARFVVAGDGPGFKDGLEHAIERGLGRAVRFTGQLSRPDVSKLLARARVLLVPSLAEPFGLVALEAAQAGVPVVASRACGFIEALPAFGEFEPLDADAAARSVIDAVKDQTRVNQWREDAGRALKRLTPTASAARVLVEVLGAGAGTQGTRSASRLAPLP